MHTLVPTAQTKSNVLASGSHHQAVAPLVSVCIVNWNCRELLRNCISSLQRRQGVSLEVIVVDNGSSDGAADMVARDFPRVRLIGNAENVGFARANNQAARAAQGDLLFFLNNDTVVPADTLAKLADYMQREPETIIVGPRLVDGEGTTQISYRRRPTVATFLHRTLLLRWTGIFRRNYRSYRRDAMLCGTALPSGPPHQTAQESRPTRESCATRESHLTDVPEGWPVDVLMGAALMVRREQFLELGAWDEDFRFGGEDLELCHRAQKRGRVTYLPHLSVTHFGRVSTRQNIAFASPRIAAGFVQYFRKSGASRSALFVYKLGITLDAPLQLVVKGCQYVVRQLLGRRQEAQRTLTAMRGGWAFLCSGLWRFSRA